ncbi:MAG: nucleotidyl transferase AbiEii/AbiGii toxin family protein [Pleurocapsa sp. CRU_1_2]|nr:nucleotidyl transferase AbiEii/AbiGii toxin family protein [Pleurocapsa sp. CRU_1_2]
MDIRRIRELVIIAMFADDDLMETLVLKGGNALDIAHDLKLRASVDVDFSMSDDFEDLEAIESKIERTLSERFDSEGYQVFDYRFKPKPKKPVKRFLISGEDIRLNSKLSKHKNMTSFN